MDYREKLESLKVYELKAIIKYYMSHLKITTTRKTKSDLIEDILKHTKYKDNKIYVKSHKFKIPKAQQKKQIKYYTKDNLFIILSKLNGNITRLKRVVEFSKNNEEVQKAKDELKLLLEERKNYINIYKQVEKGEKIQM